MKVDSAVVTVQKLVKQLVKERFTNNLDKYIYSLAGRRTTKHAKSAKMMTGKILFKEQPVGRNSEGGCAEHRLVAQPAPDIACIPEVSAPDRYPRDCAEIDHIKPWAALRSGRPMSACG